MERLNRLANQLEQNNTSAVSKVLEKHADDVVICGAYRTALTRGGKGGFKDTDSADLLAGILAGLIERTGVNPADLDEVCCGNVLKPGSGVTEHRAAQLAAGIPPTVPFLAINRQCSSGLMACNHVFSEIRTGEINIGIAAGVESMSHNYGPQANAPFSEKMLAHPEGAKCAVAMGWTSEAVATKYNLSREAQDAFAANSYDKAAKAQDAGLFKEEIIPLKTTILDKDGNATEIIVDTDDGIRRGTTVESLSKIRPAFNGSTHAGNASQISDGAGAVLLARRSHAEKLGLPIIGKFVRCRTVGVPVEIMGVGPAYAIPAVLSDLGLTLDDVDIYEINEAFASQALFSCQHLNLDMKKVNPKGGAIAFGHPLGATGARQVSTLLTELKRTGKKIGVTSMCIGTGMGAASVIVAE